MIATRPATCVRGRSESAYAGVMVRTIVGALSLSLCFAGGCSGTVDDAGRDAGADASAMRIDAGADAAATDADVLDTGVSPIDSGHDAGPPSPCEGALFCEQFDTYDVTTIVDGDRFGAWRAAQRTPGSTMDLDSAHTVSGSGALHVRIEAGERAGGRLFTTGVLPVFESRPTQLYGRMMMYIEENGPSVHWTFFGASGTAVDSSPVDGRRATYLMSSLPRDGLNTYAFVYGLSSSGDDPYRDCSLRGPDAMRAGRWTCVAFEMDSEARRLRLSVDGADPSVSVDDRGSQCVGDVPDDTLWYGPQVDELYVGAWSFHPMETALEVWIDDVVVDTSPVPCPAP